MKRIDVICHNSFNKKVLKPSNHKLSYSFHMLLRFRDLDTVILTCKI